MKLQLRNEREIYKSFFLLEKYALFASQNVSTVCKRERIREERGLFFGIIWVNGTHGSMLLALVKLEGKQNNKAEKYEAEGEAKAARQLTGRKIGQDDACVSQNIFKYSIRVYLIVTRKSECLHVRD